MRQYAYYTARCILNLAIIKTLKINIFAIAMHMHICYFCYCCNNNPLDPFCLNLAIMHCASTPTSRTSLRIAQTTIFGHSSEHPRGQILKF